MENIDSNFIYDKIKLRTEKFVQFNTLGLSDSDKPGTLTFLDNEKFLNDVINNPFITGVITTESLGQSLDQNSRDWVLFLSEDPRYDFFFLQNCITEYVQSQNGFKSEIDPSARIHPTAFVSPTNVRIAKNVEIQANATILDDVTIGDNCIIRPGTVIGAEGFEHKRTSKGILSVKHDGKVIIGKNVDIGANCAISKGFSFRNTIIDDDTRLDNLVHIAHGVQVGKRCFLPASCMIAGSTSLGNDVWVGPNASISSQIEIGSNAFITIGSVVTRSVEEGAHMTGNFAVPHRDYLKILKQNLNAVKG
jgi:UDP-3-O-[3-hydroxymyristoyl] glucosamine N-acyltransferase